MSKLTSQQKEFLKGIPNKKARQEQKIQFKLQNSYNGNVVFINGKFETDLEKLVHFMNGHPMMDIMFKEDLIPKENNHKFIDYGEFKNTIPDFKHNFNQKPLDFDLPKKEDNIELIVFTDNGIRFKYKKVLGLQPESNVHGLTMIGHSFYEKVLV